MRKPYRASAIRTAKAKNRGINAGAKLDMEDLCAALESIQMILDDIIDTVYPFDKAEEALQSLWEGKVVGKIVISSIH